MRNLIATLIGWGPVGVLLLSAMDSAGIPLPGGVDALLLVVAARRPDLAWLAAAAAVIGSIMGTWLLYTLARKGGQAYLEKHALHRRGRLLQEWFRRYGLVTVFVPALLPIPMPMKIPVVCTAVFGVRKRVFLGVVAGARIPRYFGLAWLGRQFGDNAGGWLKANAWPIVAFAAALFICLYLLARFNDRGKLADS